MNFDLFFKLNITNIKNIFVNFSNTSNFNNNGSNFRKIIFKNKILFFIFYFNKFY